jgi:hypothetical protein
MPPTASAEPSISDAVDHADVAALPEAAPEPRARARCFR